MTTVAEWYWYKRRDGHGGHLNRSQMNTRGQGFVGLNSSVIHANQKLDPCAQYKLGLNATFVLELG